MSLSCYFQVQADVVTCSIPNSEIIIVYYNNNEFQFPVDEKFIVPGVPTFPDVSRYWDMVERHKITQFYTAPTAIRAIMRFGDDPVY